MQALAVGAVIYALPDDLRVAALSCRGGWSASCCFVAGLWFVNLVNFMDGIDWMTVAEVVPIAAALVVIGSLGALPLDGVVVALALGGAMLGFAYFNRPVARLFLGDVGSLPVGLLLGWLLVQLAGSGHLAAALLLPLYYLADATITLVRRLRAASRSGRRTARTFTRSLPTGASPFSALLARVFLVNVGLGALAIVTIVLPGG